MQDTVDQAYGAVPRTLANIIEDARRAAGEADARPPGVWDLWIARLAGQGSRLDRGNDGAALSPSGGCRVLGRGLQEATVAGMLGVRPGQASGCPGHSGEFGRPMLTLADRLDQLVPAEDCGQGRPAAPQHHRDGLS